MASPRVLLADDMPEMVKSVTQLLRRDFDVVGYAENGEEAIEAIAHLNPDLLVLDISMPVLNGIQVASLLRESGSSVKLIFLTVNEDPDYIEAAFSVGASGYVFKSRIATDLIPAVEGVLRGRKFTSPRSRSR